MFVLIESTRFNDIVQRIVAILGTATNAIPSTGYGSSVTVDPFGVTGSRNQINLANVDKISADDFTNLYIDLVRARVHQIGAASFTVDPFVIGDYNENQGATDKIDELYTNALETLIGDIETDQFEIDIPTQAVIESLSFSERPQSLLGPWNGTLSHIFTVEFTSEQDRRHFFNSGGEIRFQAALDYTGSQDKTLKWQQDLNDQGIISFKANETFSNAGIGSGSGFGNYQLTGSYQLVYRNTGINPYSGSAYEIYALQNSPTELQFRVSFADTDPEGGFATDENVFGDISSTVEYARANGVVDINGIEYTTVVWDNTLSTTLVSNL